MSLSNPTVTAESEFNVSKEVTAALVELITNQSMPFENDPTHANFIVSAVKKRKVEQQKCNADRIRNELEPSSQRLIVHLNLVHQPGLLLYLLKNMAFACPRGLLETHSAFVMAGQFSM